MEICHRRSEYIHNQTLWEPTWKGRIGAKRRRGSGGRSAPKGWCEGERRCGPSCSPKAPACCSRPAKAKAPTCACIYALWLIHRVCCSLLQCVLQFVAVCVAAPKPPPVHSCTHYASFIWCVAVCVAALKSPPVAAVPLKPKPPSVHSYALWLIHRVCCSLLQCVLQFVAVCVAAPKPPPDAAASPGYDK